MFLKKNVIGEELCGLLWGMSNQDVFTPTRPVSSWLRENHMLRNGASGNLVLPCRSLCIDILWRTKCSAAVSTKHSYNATPVKTCHHACSCGIPKIGILILCKYVHATRSSSQQTPPIAVTLTALFARSDRLYIRFLGSMFWSSRWAWEHNARPEKMAMQMRWTSQNKKPATNRIPKTQQKIWKQSCTGRRLVANWSPKMVVDNGRHILTLLKLK